MPTALIIGASRGLGRGLAGEYVRRGWDVVATVRTPGGLAEQDRLTIETLDTTDWDAVDGFGETLGGRPLDLLFVNAGIYGPKEPIGDAAPDAVAEVLRVNSYAPLRIVERLAERVTADGTIAVMSSTLGSIGLNESGGTEAYRMSKAALNMGLVSIARRRKDARTYLAVHPGWVRTDMGGSGADISVEESVTGIVTMIERRQGLGGVTYVDYRDKEQPW